MSTITKSVKSLPKTLNQRRPFTQSYGDKERETFEKAQATALGKAINNNEVPAKEKHIRIAILGTFREESSNTFWSVVQRMPLQGNPVTAWKFCYVTHKILRDGHPNALSHSSQYRSVSFLESLARLWSNMREGYGKLISLYCEVLLAKISFHAKNTVFTGSLELVQNKTLEQAYGNNMDSLFQLSVEFFDYIDTILALTAAIFANLDPSKVQSVMSVGQCRISPLIPLIQDACQLYDYNTRILYKLHSALPVDLLSGHTERFAKQFPLLQHLFLQASNLTFLQRFIQVSPLRKRPDFSQTAETESADFKMHMAPVVVMEMQDADYDDEEQEGAPSQSFSLLDLSPPVPPREPPDHPPPIPPPPRERDLLTQNTSLQLQDLKEQIEFLQAENVRLRENQQLREADFSEQVEAISAKFVALKEESQRSRREMEGRVGELETSQVELQQEKTRLQGQLKSSEDKFLKMKEIYSKLREEHILALTAKRDLEQREVKSADAPDSQVLAESESNAQQVDQLREENRELHTHLLEAEEARRNAEDQMVQLLENIEELKGKLNFTSMQASTLRQVKDNVCSSLQRLISEAVREVECPSYQLVLHTSDSIHLSARDVSKLLSNLLALSPDQSQDCLPDLAVTLAHTVTRTFLLTSGVLQTQLPAATVYEGVLSEVHKLSQSACSLTELLLLHQSLSPEDSSDTRITTSAQTTLEDLQSLLEAIGAVNEISVEVSSEDMEACLEEELRNTARAIDEAAARFDELLEKSRAEMSGIKLQVNQMLLDSCTKLMTLIKELMLSVKTLQDEIVDESSSGAGDRKTYYQRNNQWSEGLLSAGKAVGLKATLLLEAADLAVTGSGKFEQVMVCAKEMASSTAQLVMASKVKASNSNSALLHQVTDASRQVAAATGEVIASAKQARNMTEESALMDFSGMSLHQTVRYEMDSQVKLMELEAALEKEREKLTQLRRRHYVLAEQEDAAEQNSGGMNDSEAQSTGD